MPIFDDFDDFDDEKEDVVFSPNSGAESSTIKAVINDTFPNQEDYLGRGIRFAVAELHIAVADVASPQHGDAYTFHGHSWDIGPEGYQRAGTNVWQVNVVRILT